MNETYVAFLRIWNYILYVLTGASLISSIGIIIFHIIRFNTLSEYKKKYDYLRDYDSKMIYYSVFCFALGVTLFVNTVYTKTVQLTIIWFFVRLFVSVTFGTLIVYLTYLLLKFAYPTVLSRKLKKWRYKPRINPKNGTEMKLLSEEEEDVHLDEGMQAEENVFSVDYDVWVDPETNDVHIEKYPGHLVAEACNSCGFQTMKQVKEEIITPPTETSEGETERYYECTYCGARRTKNLKIAKIQPDSEYILPDYIKFKEEEKVHGVTVEIHIGEGKTQVYEFSNTEQASEFLKEFELENMG